MYGKNLFVGILTAGCFSNSVRGCSERRVRSSRPKGYKIDGDLEVNDCEIGNAQAGRQ